MNMMSGASPASAGSARRLVLLRHARTAENAAGRFLGLSDPALDTHGVRQAQRLSDLLGDGRSYSVISSPARRALQSAQLLGFDDPVIEPDVREIDFGSWEGLTQREVALSDPVNFDVFAHGEIGGFPGGETVAAVATRTMAALDRHPADALIVVTHATVIRILVAALLGLPVSHYRSSLGRPGHLSWTELELHATGWRLLTYDARLIDDADEADDAPDRAASPGPDR